MEQSIFLDASTSSASQGIPRILWNPKTHYRGHNNSPPFTFRGQINSYSVSQVNRVTRLGGHMNEESEFTSLRGHSFFSTPNGPGGLWRPPGSKVTGVKAPEECRRSLAS